ncbi:threonine/serine exporter family protein [Nocardioides sp. cx-169]|uniref:threonine/serine ThrE exporter family protein n=1 Tax=Nocardioides sp. cx-169 TaxID=2899080 RepID=UPI001E47F2A8|nr:threonine/serine exporter family protein [Nocardioides sp. cx-169]MCD4536272.1 threonine/serine exporter family protein [Nocardioides sp. cx-169]
MAEGRALNLTMDFCLRVGELLLSSGAGAADVTSTMQTLAWHFGLRHPEIDVTFTSLSMSYQVSPEESPLMQVRHVKQRDIDYEDLTLVDHLVRDVIADQVDLAEARATLARIVSSGHSTPRWAVSLGWGAMCSGVGILLRGDVTVVAIAFVAAVCIDRLQLWMARRRLPFFYQQVAGGAVATLLAAAAAGVGLVENPSLVITANIIMLLAGIGFMGALQDALSGFYITAGARLTEALLATAGIIAGVSGGLTVADVAGVELRRVGMAASSWETLTPVALGAALCAGAFAFSSYAPRRIILPIALIAGLAISISQSISIQGFGRAWPTALAAFFVGVVSYTVSGRLRVPPLVVVVSAVVPMLPGLSIYRGLALMAEGGTTTSQGLLAMISAASIATALSAGVILGEYVAQPLRREASRLESRLAGPRLVGPLRYPGRRRRGRSRTVAS